MSLCPSEPFSAPPSLFADCLANAGPIVVNILSVYTMRQTWCSSHVSHHCFYLDLSNSNCLRLGNPEVRTCWVKVDILFISLSSASRVNLQKTTSNSDMKACCWRTLCMTRGRAGIRTRVWHPSFMFNQPADGLIGMLMRLARCLLDQFNLKDTTLAFQLRIRERRKSPIPIRRSPFAPDCTAGAQFNQWHRVGRADRLRRSTFAQTQAHHTSLSQLSGPVAFTAGLKNGAIKSMSETSALFLLHSLDPLIILQIRTLVHISRCCDLQPENNRHR